MRLRLSEKFRAVFSFAVVVMAIESVSLSLNYQGSLRPFYQTTISIRFLSPLKCFFQLSMSILFKLEISCFFISFVSMNGL